MDIEAWCRRVKLQHLRAVLAVAQTTSLALAAEVMGLSQPAVTKILHEIEADLDVQLFHRTSRGTTCTPAGELLVSHVRLIFAQLEQAAKAIHDSRAGLSGRVVVGALIAGAAWLLPKAVSALQAERPGVRVTIIEGTYDYLTPLLRQGQLDMIVGRLPKHEYREGLDVQERVALVVRPGHPALELKRPSLKALSAWPWILPLAGTTLRQLLESAFHDLKLELPDARVESVSVVSNRRLILETDYVCSFPWDVVQLDVQHGLLSRLNPNLPLAFGPVGVSMRKEGAPSPAGQALLDALHAVAKESRFD
jgi:LysR family pca operon transcriptional activator